MLNWLQTHTFAGCPVGTASLIIGATALFSRILMLLLLDEYFTDANQWITNGLKNLYDGQIDDESAGFMILDTIYLTMIFLTVITVITYGLLVIGIVSQRPFYLFPFIFDNIVWMILR